MLTGTSSDCKLVGCLPAELLLFDGWNLFVHCLWGAVTALLPAAHLGACHGVAHHMQKTAACGTYTLAANQENDLSGYDHLCWLCGR